MTELEMLESEKSWCENCCNWDKEHSLPDGYAECKLTGTLCFAQESGKECKCFNAPAENLIVLPCKVGQTVYVIEPCNCGHKYGELCGGNRRRKNTKWLEIVKLPPTHHHTRCLKLFERPFKVEYINRIGKTVFLSREEAEARLKEGVQG